MIRVVIVDDSPMACLILRRALSQAPEIEVVAEASDPYLGRDRILEFRPDVLILDVEMPRMDGVTFLRRLMQHFPIPTVVCSSFTETGGRVALEAFDAGAVEVICKPKRGGELGSEIVTAVRAAAQSRHAVRHAPVEPVEFQGSADVDLVAIGASTGGTVAVESIMSRLPEGMPPMIVVQHMPAYITKAFAERLNGLSRLLVSEAVDGDVLREGHVLVAPGDQHLVVERFGRELRARLRAAPRVNGHRPSVDVLFHSAAEVVGARAIGVILTGMGKDGADGLLAMQKQGAFTVAQDEATSVVFGMPRVAIELGAVDEVVPLPRIAGRLVRASEAERPSMVARAPTLRPGRSGRVTS